MMLVAQCNALSSAMPFLFERIDDETELLPGNLLRTDSVIAKLVSEIPKEDWQHVEIIGWLYQFYISEKKDEVIGKVVSSMPIRLLNNYPIHFILHYAIRRIRMFAFTAFHTFAREFTRRL